MFAGASLKRTAILLLFLVQEEMRMTKEPNTAYFSINKLKPGFAAPQVLPVTKWRDQILLH